MDYGIYCFIKFQHNSETLLEIASMFIVKHFDCVMYEPKWPDFVREQPELLMQVKLYAYHLWIIMTSWRLFCLTEYLLAQR